jgi:hypothetical protein
MQVFKLSLDYAIALFYAFLIVIWLDIELMYHFKTKLMHIVCFGQYMWLLRGDLKADFFAVLRP